MSPPPESMETKGALAFRPCVIVPTYNNPATIRRVVEAARQYVPDVIVVDDGGHEKARLEVAALGAEGLAQVHHRAENGGKGAAVKDGLRLARDAGFTHALQVDADGQHALDDIPELLRAAEATPAALVLGQPVYDESAPRGRMAARKIMKFWIAAEVGRGVIRDAMCGFRVYPLPLSAQVRAKGDRMDFDPEIAVRLVWAGAPVVHVPTKVRYLTEGEGGVSHFLAVKDNVLISLMHSRLMTARIMSAVLGWLVPPLRLRRLAGVTGEIGDGRDNGERI